MIVVNVIIIAVVIIIIVNVKENVHFPWFVFGSTVEKLLSFFTLTFPLFPSLSLSLRLLCLVVSSPVFHYLFILESMCHC